MNLKKWNRPWLWAIIVILIAFRIALPSIVKHNLNKYLADFSEVYYLHVSDVDLSIIRGAYRLEGVVGDLKKSKKNFLKAESIDVSISWRDLLRGHIRTDIVGTGVEFEGNQSFLQSLKDQAALAKKDAQALGDKVFPLTVSRIDLRKSKLTFADVDGLPEELRLRMTDIDGRVSNVTATEKEPNALLHLRATLQDSAAGVIVGEINQKKTPVEYLLSFEVKEFNLTSLNPFLKRRVPMSFNEGKADIYAEIKGEDGDVYGYVKPFVKNVKMMGDQGDFKGVKHWSIEVATAFSNFVLKSPQDKTVATKFNFAYKAGNMEWSLGEVLGKAFKHGFGDDIKPGLDNDFKMKNNEEPKKQTQP